MVIISFVTSLCVSAFVLSFFNVSTGAGILDYHYVPPFKA